MVFSQWWAPNHGSLDVDFEVLRIGLLRLFRKWKDEVEIIAKERSETHFKIVPIIGIAALHVP